MWYLYTQAMVDEAPMTGENFPVRKAALSQSPFKYEEDLHAPNTLRAGSVVLRTQNSVPNMPTVGIVVSTGFGTSKGRLLRRIIYPIGQKRTFFADALYFIIFMGMISAAMFGFSAAVFVRCHSLASILPSVCPLPPPPPVRICSHCIYTQRAGLTCAEM